MMPSSRRIDGRRQDVQSFSDSFLKIPASSFLTFYLKTANFDTAMLPKGSMEAVAVGDPTLPNCSVDGCFGSLADIPAPPAYILSIANGARSTNAHCGGWDVRCRQDEHGKEHRLDARFAVHRT
jgi:hypothetical protein